MRRNYSDSDEDDRPRKKRKGPQMPNFDFSKQMGNINMLDMVNEHGRIFCIS
jgi:hypothetical protein